MNNLCIIPARGGSKRIPRKNIKDFFGKPIIAYTIETALQSNLFDEVMVSTDDQEIASIAIKYGAKVPFLRSIETSNDNATIENVIEEVLDKYGINHISFNNFCCIFPTAPLLTRRILVESFDLYNKSAFNSLIPVLRYSYPIQRALRLVSGQLEMREVNHIHTRSQDLEPMFHDAGLFYWMNIEKFYHYKEILCGNTGMYELSESDVQDIDNEDDWKIAEFKFEFFRK